MKRLFLLLFLAAAGILYGQGEDRGLFREAESRFESGDYVLAQELYQNLARKYPLSSFVPDSHFRTAQCRYYLGLYPEALTQWDLVASRYGSTRFIASLPYWKGLTYYRLARYPEAAASLETYLLSGAQGSRNQALLYDGLSLKEMGRYDEAAAILAELYGSFSKPEEEPYVRVLLGDLYLKTGETKALGELLKDTDPESAPEPWRDYLLFQKGEWLYLLGETGDAEPLYRQLTSSGESLAGASYRRLFSIYQARGDREAMTFLLSAAESDLRNRPELLRDFWLRIGIAYYENGEYSDAEFHLKRVWNTPPLRDVSPLVPLYLARITALRGDPERALRYITGYMQVSVLERERMLFTLGELKTRLGQWQEAEAAWTGFWSEYPGSALSSYAAYYSGYTDYRLGRYGRALERLETVGLAGLSGEQRRSVLRLKARLYGRTGDYRAAGAAWQDYLAVYPQDYDARGEALKARFMGGDYREVISGALVLKRRQETRADRALAISASYLSGLAHLSLEEWPMALEDLMPLTEASLREAGLEGMYPWVLYYRGWSQYRISRFDRALKDFSELAGRAAVPLQGTSPGTAAAGDPASGSGLTARGAYLAGWCAFQLKDYKSAAEYFLQYSRSPEKPDQGRLMYARSLSSEGLLQQAVAVLESTLKDYPGSASADDTLFELGDLLTRMDRIEEAQEKFQALYRNYPASPLAEESLFRRGENYMAARQWAKAREAFYDCRTAFPRGALAAAAHYWGGEAAFQGGEVFGAVLLWEKLIDQFPDSSFRPVAMKKTGDIYMSRGDYTRALAYYTELTTAYPDEAKEVDAVTVIEKLRFLQRGETETAAGLRALIATKGGLESPESREAMLELARILIYRGGDDREEGRLLLEDLVFYKNEDLDRAARAQFYLGEYRYSRSEYLAARDAFLEAASMNPADRDLRSSGPPNRRCPEASGRTRKSWSAGWKTIFPIPPGWRRGRPCWEENHEATRPFIHTAPVLRFPSGSPGGPVPGGSGADTSHHPSGDPGGGCDPHGGAPAVGIGCLLLRPGAAPSGTGGSSGGGYHH